MTVVYRYYTTDELPVIPIYWKQSAGTYYDFASGWTFVARFVAEDGTLEATKSTGITGAAGTDSVPNVTIAPASGELAAIGAGVFDVRVTATRTADSFQLTSPPNELRVHIDAVPA